MPMTDLGLPRTVRPSDPDYPTVLRDLKRPPEQFSLLGAMPDLERAVAIVGTRSPDRSAALFTRRLASELSEAGWLIISGGALGIDTEAHRGALDVGGQTLAVLATGVVEPYPARNSGLFREIIGTGALLSELEGESPRFKGVFLERNRLVAALAKVVIVVQAPLQSGALSTAAHAKRLGRAVLAVPHAPWEPRGAGCLTLLSNGAGVCRNSADVLSLAAPTGRESPGQQPKRPTKREHCRRLDEDERSVVEALSYGALQVDELCEQTQLPAPRVQRAVLMLLLSKVIQEVGCGRYARTDCL